MASGTYCGFPLAWVPLANVTDLAVYSDDNDAPSIGEYDLTFSANAQLQGNDVDINGLELPYLVTVGGNGASASGASSTASTSPSGTTGPSGIVASATSMIASATSNVAAVSGATTPSSGAMMGHKVPAFGGLVGGLVAWALI